MFIFADSNIQVADFVSNMALSSISITGYPVPTYNESGGDSVYTLSAPYIGSCPLNDKIIYCPSFSTSSKRGFMFDLSTETTIGHCAGYSTAYASRGMLYPLFQDEKYLA